MRSNLIKDSIKVDINDVTLSVKDITNQPAHLDKDLLDLDNPIIINRIKHYMLKGDTPCK